jgi:D-beta-D-heptose 7-phosphate kinase/D-beta-D-heptose 1-phosphate adenosyltransferase
MNDHALHLAIQHLRQSNPPPRILVVGDAMLDLYENPSSGTDFPQHVPGGAANVAANIAALGGLPVLIAAIGDDDEGERLSASLDTAGVEPRLHLVPGHPTTTKTRTLRGAEVVARHDRERCLPRAVANDLLVDHASALDTADAVVLSDYRKGVLTNVAAWISHARARGIPVLVDTKDPRADCRGADLVTPNLTEVRQLLGAHCRADEVADQAPALLTRLGSRAVLATLGADGMLLAQPRCPPLRLPALGPGVDPTGAGDTVVAAMAIGMATGMGVSSAAHFAAQAAAIAAAQIGTTAVSFETLEAFCTFPRATLAWGS